ncbi:alpha/beta fold hydrolase [Sphingopyxis sp.]|uniref:alpha/beta fold hydrolase n=1 Tax=Sphingopyxis sp. TaxID=1908224 RepID=UPI0026268AC6|nr:alpha/beta fold hydrolase [Sphingopyxis sp.]MCW0199424.1 alpha/beta fold hydrolase [Sphingopyxis sp.]
MTRPLLLLPGLNNTGAVFADVVAAIDPRIDARAPTLPALDRVDALADHLLAGLPGRFHLCGFSFGGYVALAMLARAPDRIAGLALAGSLPGADGDAGRDNRERAIATARSGGYEAMVQANATAAFHPDSIANADLMARRAAMVADYGAGRFIAHSAAAMARPDRTDRLASFDGPLILMAGEADPLTPRARMEELVGSARTHVVAGAGHLLPMERPRAMADLLSHWMLDN